MTVSSDPAALNADLHCHSLCSDGVLSPAALARRAADNAVALWALTDHDDVSGLDEARHAAQAVGLPFVGGVEVSVSFLGETVHIVGLGIDWTQPDLLAGLAQIRSGRDARAQAIAAELERCTGLRDVYAGALRHAGNPALLSRTHFARLLVESGICRHTHEVFARFLTPGKPGYVEHVWATLADAVGWIRAAGGVAVIAHPGRYRFDAAQERELIATFAAAGGQGIEVVTSSHTAAQMRHYAERAREFGLAASRGSDFHSPQESPCDLGRLPPLPAGLTPVWSLLH